MDGETLQTDLETNRETELARLGSDRRLVAVTTADLDAQSILEAAYTAERAAVETFRMWEESEPNDAAKRVFDTVVETERKHVDRIRTELDADGEELPGDSGALHTHLRNIDGTVSRIGAGLVARPMIGSRTLLQFVNYFVNQADQRRADLFRSLRTETTNQLKDGLDIATRVCDTEADWKTARHAGQTTIDVVYDEYVQQLDSVGVDPKPIC